MRNRKKEALTKKEANNQTKSNKITNILTGLLATLCLGIIASFVWSSFSDFLKSSIITYCEASLHISAQTDRNKVPPIFESSRKRRHFIFEPLKNGEVQGKVILITNDSNNKEAAVAISREDDFGIEKVFLGSNLERTPWSIIHNMPKIRFFDDEFSVDNIHMENHSSLMLFLTTRNPKIPIKDSTKTHIVTQDKNDLLINQQDVMKFLPLIFTSTFGTLLFSIIVLVLYLVVRISVNNKVV